MNTTLDLAAYGVSEIDAGHAANVEGGSPPKVVLAVWLARRYGPGLLKAAAEAAGLAAGAYAASR